MRKDMILNELGIMQVDMSNDGIDTWVDNQYDVILCHNGIDMIMRCLI